MTMASVYLLDGKFLLLSLRALDCLLSSEDLSWLSLATPFVSTEAPRRAAVPAGAGHKQRSSAAFF